jgi:uncharacterized membrane protein
VFIALILIGVFAAITLLRQSKKAFLDWFKHVIITVLISVTCIIFIFGWGNFILNSFGYFFGMGMIFGSIAILFVSSVLIIHHYFTQEDVSKQTEKKDLRTDEVTLKAINFCKCHKIHPIALILFGAFLMASPFIIYRFLGYSFSEAMIFLMFIFFLPVGIFIISIGYIMIRYKGKFGNKAKE